MHHQYSMKISPRFRCFMVKPPLFNMFMVDYLSWLYPSKVAKVAPSKALTLSSARSLFGLIKWVHFLDSAAP